MTLLLINRFGASPASAWQHKLKLTSLNAQVNDRTTNSIDNARSQNWNCGLSILCFSHLSSNLSSSPDCLSTCSQYCRDCLLLSGVLGAFCRHLLCYGQKLFCYTRLYRGIYPPSVLEESPKLSQSIHLNAHASEHHDKVIFTILIRPVPLDLVGNCIYWLISAVTRDTCCGLRNATVSLILFIPCLTGATEWASSRRSGGSVAMLTSNEGLLFLGACWADQVTLISPSNCSVTQTFLSHSYFTVSCGLSKSVSGIARHNAWGFFEKILYVFMVK